MKYIEYADFAKTTDTYEKNAGYNCTILIGLVSELGEYCSHIAKYLRGDFDKLNSELLVKELGDIMWYVAAYHSSRIKPQIGIEPTFVECGHMRALKDASDNLKIRVLTSDLALSVMNFINASMSTKDEKMIEAWEAINNSVNDNAKLFEYTYEDVLRISYEKLTKRLKDGTIKGSGDNR